uniref:S-adenosylmethionine synthetase n=1 Tax=uncultured prokaryote TaxID=198431 RepID=H5SIQ7_9ZZZZ|nr:S-adenosylmethionine synthetase [uncultured prokaryote]
MPNITIEELKQTPVEQQRVELVERKGTGHPDSICDAIMEEVSVALCREYLNTFGRVLHHNIDKGLLVAGRTAPRLGGGTVLEPMRLVFGDRATAEYKGKRIDVGAIAIESAKEWLRQNLRFVDPEQHIVFQNELKEGSPELTDLFEREVIGANDTSAAVGYAPLTETERIVFATERYLNSPEFKQLFPEAGEDVKVMGYRRDRELVLTIALAFVDRYVTSAERYFARKEEIQVALEEYLAREQRTLDRITVTINTLDDPARGEGGMYLTVLGTSAEGGDCGQVGRGNKVNGVISLNRPMGTEAAAGKNPVSHVGKIYTLLTHRIAAEIYASVPGLREVYVWLCSQIGKPIDQPLIASAQLILQKGVALADVEPQVTYVIEHELAHIHEFTARLARGELPVW